MSALNSSDRNLLFAILALQMDFVGRDVLMTAMNARVLTKARPLGEILVDQNVLSRERCALLDALVEEHLRQHDNDTLKCLVAVSPIGSACKDLERVADADVQASLARVAAARPAEDVYATRAQPAEDACAARAQSVGAATLASMRFRILRPHARGGLGEVFVAEDSELHREIALKQLQDNYADDQDSRARFVLEAEITGRLEHPGIVPVYGLGQYADGRPYYAMRFIRGDSLKEAIECFHDSATSGPVSGEHAVAFRKLLGRFLDVCNAIDYAHSRGVLHRDLKPGNIMLGKHGETLVVDWGLAKALGAKEASAAGEEMPLRPSGQSGATETLAGAAMGTPAFMSPEQAAGRLDLLGPASDVYSLGATLYVLLTRKPAVIARDVGQVLQKVQRGDFPPPRQVRRDVPRALEAICLRAMALRPEDRYATPRALADDIEHWLADERVSAFREPLPARAARWARRHRTSVTAAVAALLVAVVGLLTATALLTAANERERHAKALAEESELEANAQRDEANRQRDEVQKQRDEVQRQRDEVQKQRDKARERFQLAREAVDKFHTRVSESPEMKAKGVEKLRTELLESAVDFYEKLSKEEEGGDPVVQRERARTFGRLADLSSAVGRHEQAEKAYQTALDIQKNLAAGHAAVAEYQNDLAHSHNNLGALYRDTGRNVDAEKAFLIALDIGKKLAADHPLVAEYQGELALSQNSLGRLYFATGRNADAEEVFRAVLDIRKKLAVDQPTVSQYQKDLAWSHNNLGVLYSKTGRNADAETAYQAALDIRQKLAADQPTVTEHQRNLAVSHNNLGVLYGKTGRNADAAKAYQAALDIQKKLAADHPTVIEYQNDVARSHGSLGLLYRATGRHADAEKAYQAALDIQKKLASDHPTVTEYQIALALSHNNLGILYGATGRNADAAKASQAALDIRKKLAADHPTVTEYQSDLARSHLGLGVLHRATGRTADAEQAYQAALDIQKKLAADHPTVIQYQSDLANSHNSLNLLYRASGRTADAEKACQAALDIQRKLAADHPTVPEYQGDLAFSHNNLGVLYHENGRHAEAEKAHQAALDIRKKLAADHPTVTQYQGGLADSHNNLGLLYRATGRHADAAKAYQAALDIRKKLAADNPTVTQYQIEIARTLGNLANLVRDTDSGEKALVYYEQGMNRLEGVKKKNQLNSPARVVLRNLYSGRAMALGSLGRHVQAVRDWGEAIDLDSGQLRTFLRTKRSASLAAAGDHARAIAEADELARALAEADKLTKEASLDLYNLACAYALSSAAVRKDLNLAVAERMKSAEEYAGRAVELLNRAAVAGHFKDSKRLVHLKNDTDLEALRERADFKKLIADLSP